MQTQDPIRSIDLFCNDLYQFTCSYSYFVQNKHQQIASFQIFFRKYPFKGQYVIFAGLQSIKDFIKNLKFTQQHEIFLKSIFPHMQQQYFKWIKQDFSDKITFKSMKQGEIVFANQPILSYTGPLGFIQMLETPFLNLLGFASLVATNASRMIKAVHPKKCLQFGTRRAQGPDGALSASQYAYIGGFFATSNVECAKKLGIKCLGTMSHAYVTSFSSLKDVQPFSFNNVPMKDKVIENRKKFGFKTHEGQLAAFLNFAMAFPDNFTTLIDTYDTLQSGILNTIIVGSALIQAGINKIGIRLDSGNLSDLSKKCRKIWNQYVPHLRLSIVASDDLYEQRLIELQNDHSEVDIYAIGTNIATCKKQPALGLVCKLVQLNGVPKMKLSATIQKATYPCLKNIYRIKTEDHLIFDLIALNNQRLQPNQQISFGSIKDIKLTTKRIKEVRLINDQLDMKVKKIQQVKSYVQWSMKQLPEQIFKLQNATAHKVYMTEGYIAKYREAHRKAEEKVDGQK